MNKLIVLILSFIFTTTSMSTVFCVSNQVELEDALAIADSNNQADHIKIKTGTNTAPSGGFIYDGANELYDLEISGGWSTLSVNPCGIKTTSFLNTELYGSNSQRVLFIRSNASSYISISNLTFAAGSAAVGLGGGLYVKDASLFLENSTFIGNTAPLGGAALAVSNGIRHIIRNNVFFMNHSTIFAGAISITMQDGSVGVYFTNNTVSNNDTTSTSMNVSSGLNLTVSGLSKALIANNILWGNETNDIVLGGSGFKYLYHNDIGSQTGQAADEEIGNFSINPQFENAATLNYAPKITSLVLDMGIHPNTLLNNFQNLWAVGIVDNDGEQRVQNDVVDIGAYEIISDIIFFSGFD